MQTTAFDRTVAVPFLYFGVPALTGTPLFFLINIFVTQNPRSVYI
jgi:hypothetical protein